VFLFYVGNHTSPTFLLRADGRFLAKSSTGLVFVYLVCPVTSGFCSVAELPIDEGFCSLLSRDGRYGVVGDGKGKGK
jgi:hypothetical protein